jgi:hypothetical protein
MASQSQRMCVADSFSCRHLSQVCFWQTTSRSENSVPFLNPKLHCRVHNRALLMCVYSFIHQWLYSPLLRPGLFFSFVIFFMRSVGPLGRGISPSQGRYLHTGQHKHRTKAHTNIHALSGIRTHDPGVRASEHDSCLTPHGHCVWILTLHFNSAPWFRKYGFITSGLFT